MKLSEALARDRIRAGAVKDVLAPVNTTDSTSPSIRRAAEEPSNWRRLGEDNPKKAIKDNLNKHPLNPKDLLKGKSVAAGKDGYNKKDVHPHAGSFKLEHSTANSRHYRGKDGTSVHVNKVTGGHHIVTEKSNNKSRLVFKTSGFNKRMMEGGNNNPVRDFLNARYGIQKY